MKWTYRYSVLWQLDGVAMLENFYLVAAPGGKQAVMVFTLSPQQAENLGARDLALVAGLELPVPAKKETALHLRRLTTRTLAAGVLRPPRRWTGRVLNRQ